MSLNHPQPVARRTAEQVEKPPLVEGASGPRIFLSNSGHLAWRRLARFAAPVLVLIAAASIYSALYFREQSVAAAIGANLVPAERVLKGEVPYRDFYKIQTPGILFLNAGLFKLRETSLATALWGVMVFKALTIAMVFLVARLVTNWKVALVPALLSFVWLPPGGPFRPAPVQYEILFILIAVYFTLGWIDSRRPGKAFVAGMAIGIVALFKQNVGVYCAAALIISILATARGAPAELEAPGSAAGTTPRNKALLYAAIAMAIPLAGLGVYLLANDALAAALRVFLLGPGEHLRMKLTGYPLPHYAALVFVAIAAAVLAATYAAKMGRGRATSVLLLMVVCAGAAAAIVPEAAIDNSIYWFAPALLAFAAYSYIKGRSVDAGGERSGRQSRHALLVLLLFSAASFGEVFPRSVRGLVIGTLPPAFILFAFLLYRARDEGSVEAVRGSEQALKQSSLRNRAALALISVVLLVFALRLIIPHYLRYDSNSGLSFRADRELGFARGRGVYFPSAQAQEVDSIVELIHSRVGEGGYFFAHSLDAASYYFLSGRSSPTGATLWNDAGTSDAERVRTMEMLREKQVRLVLTNEAALGSEPFRPLAEYLNNDFSEATRVGKTIILERNY